MFGAVISEPLEAAGLAPSISRKSVRSRSGTGTLRCEPNMSADESCFGYWSSVLPEKTFRLPSACSIARM